MMLCFVLEKCEVLKLDSSLGARCGEVRKHDWLKFWRERNGYK